MKPKSCQRTVTDCQGRTYSWKEVWKRHRNNCESCGAFEGWSGWYDASEKKEAEGFHRHVTSDGTTGKCTECGETWKYVQWSPDDMVLGMPRANAIITNIKDVDLT